MMDFFAVFCAILVIVFFVVNLNNTQEEEENLDARFYQHRSSPPPLIPWMKNDITLSESKPCYETYTQGIDEWVIVYVVGGPLNLSVWSDNDQAWADFFDVDPENRSSTFSINFGTDKRYKICVAENTVARLRRL